MLSVPVWLFAAAAADHRPVPDWQVLPVALLVYFQAPALVYLQQFADRAMAIVFLLLSLEALVALPPEERWIAVILGSVATVFKETAILLLPTIWLLACVEWRGLRPSIRRGGITVGVASVAPFLIYYAIRRGVQIERGYEIAGIAGTWTTARVNEWIANVRAQLGVGGMLAVAAAMVWSLRSISWIATALAVALFFFADTASIPYTGYGRFLAYSLIAVCGAVFASTYRSAERERALIVLCAVLAVLQLPAVDADVHARFSTGLRTQFARVGSQLDTAAGSDAGGEDRHYARR